MITNITNITKKKNAVAGLIFLILFLPAFFMEAKEKIPEHFSKKVHSLIKHTVPLITPTELASELKEQKTEGKNIPVLLDTREQKEFAVSRIPGARYVGFDDFSLERLAGISKDDPVIVYCSLGVRSEIIGEKLKKAGFKNVKNLFGGIFQWVHKGYNVVDENNKPTRKVHTFSKKWGKWLFKGEKVY